LERQSAVNLVTELAAETYDLITAFMSCHHVDSSDRFGEIVRALRPGGVLIVREHALECTDRGYLDALHLLISLRKVGKVTARRVLDNTKYRTKARWIWEFEDRGMSFVAQHQDTDNDNPMGVCYLVFVKGTILQHEDCYQHLDTYDGERTEGGARVCYFTKDGTSKKACQPFDGEVLNGSKGEPRLVSKKKQKKRTKWDSQWQDYEHDSEYPCYCRRCEEECNDASNLINKKKHPVKHGPHIVAWMDVPVSFTPDTVHLKGNAKEWQEKTILKVVRSPAESENDQDNTCPDGCQCARCNEEVHDY